MRVEQSTKGAKFNNYGNILQHFYNGICTLTLFQMGFLNAYTITFAGKSYILLHIGTTEKQ